MIKSFKTISKKENRMAIMTEDEERRFDDKTMTQCELDIINAEMNSGIRKNEMEIIIKKLSDGVSVVGIKECVEDATLEDFQNLEIPSHWLKEQEEISRQLDLIPQSEMDIERELSTPDSDEVMTDDEPKFLSADKDTPDDTIPTFVYFGSIKPK